MSIEPPDNLPTIPPGELHPGDALLTSGEEWYSEPIQQITGSPWSHAAMVVETDGGLCVAEMTSPRCRIVPLWEWLKGNAPAWTCRLRDRLTDERSAVLAAYWQTRVGERYGYALLARLASVSVWQQVSTWLGLPTRWRRIQPLTFGDVCSTTVADAWRAIGLAPDEDTGMVPGDIPRQTFLRPIERIDT